MSESKNLSLEEFAAQQPDGRKKSYLDDLPEDVQLQLLTTKQSVRTSSAWLRSLGYDATNLDAWRRTRRAERGIEP